MQRTRLDELMIVNPGSPTTAMALRVGTGSTACDGPDRHADGGRLYLGADGMVYEVNGMDGNGPGRYFLGADGTLYETDR